MKIRAFGYTRVSGISQTLGHGPKRQRELILEHAKRSGIEIVGWFDEAWTGKDEVRPEFVKMLGVMGSDVGVKVIIVESLDRFARDLSIQMLLLAKIASLGLTLFAANTGEDVTAAMLGDPMRKAMIQMQGVFAELDKDQLVRKLKAGKEAKRALGLRCDGRLPYGAEPGEVDILARMRRLRAKPKFGGRLSYQGIADRLNADGLPSRGGKAWRPSTVQQILKRESAKTGRKRVG